MNLLKGYKIAVLFAVGILVAGCASKVTTSAQFSGFLADYSKLQETESASGQKVLRWVAPDFNVNNYTGVYYTPLVYYPRSTPTQRVSQKTLDQVLAYANKKLEAAFSQQLPLVNSPKRPNTLIVRAAITAVSAETKDIQVYEVVPIAAVIAGTMAATGNRTQHTALYLEVQVIDSNTGKPVIVVVRKAYGKDISNSNTPITADDVKSTVDGLVYDIVNFRAKS
ncbi:MULTISPECIES: DUF3313 domain-containing protein [Yersinia]|uniref:DUF3313 domain-containing protein n=1 Tax=Yersinia TaxID=629 RepID=UPI0005DA6FA8|nr:MULTISPECIES: DUF3313 domain-containing protein [Yersinia]OVZ98614.1 DUF3313 domain-containing protein [Yersinia frederiksenii]RXA94410.1 DUF3313 domain-containing protein [Yersinia sp. 2105 StPb PI]CNI12843.1 putative outer membrane lipoprotein [Yersinia frederiksenii]CNI45926.1 putative outer membrane lipoprotein [Yersinia frederiksenii]CNK69025.1 putative outer membrane lipoprotein [Yersinia frederiksenii]